MDISISEPIERAWNKTIEICFDPFDLKKWFVMGFSAFLAHLFSGFGGGGNYQYTQQQSYSSEDVQLGEWLEQWLLHALNWIRDHLVLVITLSVVITVVLTALWLLVIWLRSRGKFLFLDNVVHDRGRVVKPWSQYRSRGNNLCWFLIIFWSVVFGLWLGVTLLGGGLGTVGFLGKIHSAWMWIGILVSATATIGFLLISVLFNFCLNNFVVPIMFLRDVNAVPAWKLFYREFLSGQAGAIVLYGLVKFALGMASFVLIFLFGCLTCCVGFFVLAIPYVGSVLLLPISVFLKSFNLSFLEQWGDRWQFFP